MGAQLTAVMLAEQEITQAITQAMTDREALKELRTGRLPISIALAAVRYAQERSAYLAAPRGLTKSLEAWRAAVSEMQAWLGRDPTSGELAEHCGKGRTTAWIAIRKLQALGQWPQIKAI